MGKIYQGGVYILSENTKPVGTDAWDSNVIISPKQRDLLLSNYDGLIKEFELALRRYFPISKIGIDRLYKKSDDDNRIMLQVENIADPFNVYIEWLPYNRELIDLSKFDYFIISNDLWNGRNPPIIPDGIKDSIGQIIVAAIGKNINPNSDDTYHVLINNVLCKLVNDPETGGGPPPGSGLGVPPL